jgi:dTDP-4-amino-4,6-dideoxygalactose transaminase
MGRDKYENIRIGMTGRLDTMQAVVLDAKLDIFADELVHRQNAADRYAALLEGVVGTPSLAAGVTSSWAQYVIQLPQGSDRDTICKSLANSGVPTAIYYPAPMHRQPPYAHYPVSACNLPVTMDLCDHVLALPMHPYLESAQQALISSSLKDALATA